MSADLHSRWARLLLRGFYDAGVRELVLSPGSRSTPLALAAAALARTALPELRVHAIIDERSAAFFGLGIARATGIPPLVLCTSGTAGGHYLPAVLEADQACVPLILVTADRPHELQGCGAPQTIDQVKLFGDHVRRFVDLGVPDPHPAALAALGRIAAQCWLESRGPTPGPIHLDARFRRPLEPVPDETPGYVPRALEVFGPRSTVDPAAIDRVEAALRRSERGLIVCGAAASATAAPAAVELAERCGFPLLVETTSQLRQREEGGPSCHGFDTFLRSRTFRDRHPPDLVLELGEAPISGGYAELVEHGAGGAARCPRIVVTPHRWSDPWGSASTMVIAEPEELMRALLGRALPRREGGWLAAFRSADAVVWDEVERALAGHAHLVEGTVARTIAAGLPGGSLLMLGNSMPLRDMDVFARGLPSGVGVLHQRGANGIDGLVAGAIGAQVATGRPVILVSGDVSLTHDLGSLALARHASGPLVIVVIENGGGRIFEELPLAHSPALAIDVERLFVMPPGLDFAHAGALFGLEHVRVETPAALSGALASAIRRAGACLIEATVNPRESAACRRAMRAAVQARLEAT